MPGLTQRAGLKPVIRTERLSKRYGTTDALHDLSLTVRAGEIYGFLGPNGAGKTTTVRLLLGQERPTSGTIEILGRAGAADPFVSRRQIGVVGEHQYLYDDMSAWEYLLFFGRLYGVPRPAERAAALLDRFQLSEFRRVLARDFSHGMQQKLGLARALMHEPALLILDEPVSGLDPHGIRQVREALLEANQCGVTIIVMSHILSEVERTAHRVGILHGGRLVAEDSVAAIGARLQPDAVVSLDVADVSMAVVAALEQEAFVRSVGAESTGPETLRLTLRLRPGDHRRTISALVAAHGGLIVRMQQMEVSLEDAFVQLTSDNVAAAAGRPVPGPRDSARPGGGQRRGASPAARRSKA